MKKILYFISIYIMVTTAYGQEEPYKIIPHSPESNIPKLFIMYKKLDTNLGKEITTGKFFRIINELEKQIQLNKGKLLQDTKNFGLMIDSYQIIESVEKDNYAIVSIFWVLNNAKRFPLDDQNKKIQTVQYLMKKIDNTWKITNARLTNEYNLYDQQSIQSINKRILRG